MALSGRVSGYLRGREYRVEWSASQSISGNYSVITCKHYLINDSTFSLYINGRSNTCNVGGVSASYSSAAISTGGGSTIHLGTTTHTVYHNADGSKSVTITGVFNIQATLDGSYVSSVTASGTVTLDAIPRAATITSAPNFTDEDNPVLKYSNPAGSVVDKLRAYIEHVSGSDTVTIISPRDISKSGTSYTFKLTDDEREVLQSAAKNAKSITARFVVHTGIDDTDYWSWLDKTLTIANAEPTLSPTVKDTNATTKALTGDEAKFVRGYSNAAFTVGASVKKGASIKSQGVTCGGKSSAAASGTLSAVEGASFVFSVTDSRGYTATKTLTKTLIDYVALTCSMKVGTPTADGKCAISISGSYFNGSFGAVANTLTVQYRQSSDGGSTWGAWVDAAATKSGNSYSADVALTGLDYQTAYTFQARAVDKLATVPTATKTVKATPVFDWGEDSFNFNVPVHLPNSTAVYGANASGTPRNLVHINQSNQSHFGYGSYAAGEGSVVYNGNEVYIRSKEGVYINGNLLADQPVAHGTSGIWTYWKLASGLAIVSGFFTLSETINSAWGSIYESSAEHYWTYPFAFKEKPACSINVSNCGEGGILSVEIADKGSVSRTPYFYYTRGATGYGTYNIETSIIAIGRWK